MTQFSGTLYPDRTFTLGQVPRKKARLQDKQYERDVENQPETDYGALADFLIGKTSVLDVIDGKSEAPLLVKAPESSRNSKIVYGKHGITGYGRKVVRNTSILFERKYGRERLGFVTCTLPEFPEILFKRLVGVWGEVVRRFYQKLKRQLAKICRKFTYLGVTEIQEKRFKNGGLPAPHLHFVYVCRDGKRSRYYLYVCQIHRAWNQALAEGISICNGVNTTAHDIPHGGVHCKTVRKSCSAYLGKYISKGVKVLKDMAERGFDEFPKQWWSASIDAKAMFKDSLVSLDTYTCSSFFYDFEHYLHEGVIIWGNFISAIIGGESRVIGLIGTLSKQAYAALVP